MFLKENYRFHQRSSMTYTSMNNLLVFCGFAPATNQVTILSGGNLTHLQR